jgi:prephenate dehydrogenase
MKTVAIIGIGLMGGSLGAALRRARPRWRVVGIGRKKKSLERARRAGLIDEAATDLAAGLRGADVVVVATPVSLIVPFVKKIRPHLGAKMLVMDVGSVKADIVRHCARLFSAKSGPAFVGAHPMTGSEKTGFEWARPDLYKNAACILTPVPGAPPAALIRARQFWRAAGSRVHEMSAAAHDQWLAAISHLPHLIAHALILSAAQKPGARQKVAALAAGSFRDATRVAGADPGQWNSILNMNSKNLREAARRFTQTMDKLMKQKFPISMLGRARALRAGLDR